MIEDYLNGSFKQEKTYKRFIRELPEYSQLLLTKTDDEVATIQENIKTIFKCILLEDAHLRFAVLAGGNIISANDFSTSIYSRSSLARNVKIKIDILFSDFEVKYLNNKISGWNAISYYAYEISKITGQLSSLSRTLGRPAKPQDLMFLWIEEAASSISDSSTTDISEENQLLSSTIEGDSSSSIVYNFEMPNLLVGNLSTRALVMMLDRTMTKGRSVVAQGSLTSNMCFAVTLKPGTLDLSALGLDDITSDEQRAYGAPSSVTVDDNYAGKGDLQAAVLESLKAGETVLLNYDDVFGDDPNISLINKIKQFVDSDQDLNAFVFENFIIKIKYKVFVSYSNAGERFDYTSGYEPERISLNGTYRELKSLGLYGDQKISAVFASTGDITTYTPILGSMEETGTVRYGGAFTMTDLCVFEKEVFSYNSMLALVDEGDHAAAEETLKNGQFISNLMVANNTSPLASEFKGNGSINIFLSCMLPIANIINEATSYSVEEVQKEIASEDGEAGSLGTIGLIEVRDIIFKPIGIQNKICARVSKDLLKNV